MSLNEQELINDVYDYLFENDSSIGTNFADEFPDSYIDTQHMCIYLDSEELGLFKLTLERIEREDNITEQERSTQQLFEEGE